MASIFVEPIAAERDGFELRNALIDDLQSDGEEHGKAYHLKVVLNRSPQGIALQNDATITPLQQHPDRALHPVRRARQGHHQRHPDPDGGL